MKPMAARRPKDATYCLIILRRPVGVVNRVATLEAGKLRHISYYA